MEDINFREQPLEEPANVSSETIEDSAVSVNGSLTNKAVNEDMDKNTSDNLGKFKSASALLEAYNNLQSEFTKKCQRLSELEKDKIAVEVKQITSEDVDQTLEQFLLKNTEAKDYAEEIREKLLSQSSASLADAENAWNSIVINHIKTSYGKVEDKIVDKYVLSDENVRNKIIQDYLNSLQTNISPVVISSNKGQRVSDFNSDAPETLSQAKALMEKMFS